MASVDVGYCTTEDVRLALREVDLEVGNLDPEFVRPAILGESEWIQEDTDRHWFAEDGVDNDDGDEPMVSAEPLTHEYDEQDIPSSPHADNAQAFRGSRRGRQPRYPARFAGPYTRVGLARRDVIDLEELLVRNQDGSVTDWVEDDRREEGRGEDYYLQVDDSSGRTHLYLHTGSIPRLSDYGAAVTATYSYGTEITTTVRRATASLAASDLLRDDEAAISIPDSGQLVPIETKADKLYEKGLRLLEIHR